MTKHDLPYTQFNHHNRPRDDCLLSGGKESLSLLYILAWNVPIVNQPFFSHWCWFVLLSHVEQERPELSGWRVISSVCPAQKALPPKDGVLIVGILYNVLPHSRSILFIMDDSQECCSQWSQPCNPETCHPSWRRTGIRVLGLTMVYHSGRSCAHWCGKHRYGREMLLMANKHFDTVDGCFYNGVKLFSDLIREWLTIIRFNINRDVTSVTSSAHSECACIPLSASSCSLQVLSDPPL